MPGPCQEMLNEAPYLRNKKQKIDQADYKRRESMKDRCKVMAQAAKVDTEQQSKQEPIVIMTTENQSHFDESVADDAVI